MRKRKLCIAALLFLLYPLWMLWMQEPSKEKALSALLKKADGEQVWISGIVSRREASEKYHICYLESIQSVSSGKRITDHWKFLIYIPQNKNIETVRVGNRIEVGGRLDLFETAVNPGMFDQRQYYHRRGIAAGVWAESVRIRDASVRQPGEFLCRTSILWSEKLCSILGEKQGGILSAMLFGEKHHIPAETKEIYRQSGIGHILAISALHMTFIGMGLYRLLRTTGLPFLPAGCAGGLFLSVYTGMIGEGASSLRALVMYLIRMGAEITGRTYDLAISLSAAAMVILFSRPFWMGEAGFLLSFSAVLGLLLQKCLPEDLWQGRSKKEKKKKEKKEKNNQKRQKRFASKAAIRASLISSFSIQAVMFPLLLYFYYEIPLYAIFLNLVVIPLMSWILGAGFAGSFLLLFGNIGLVFLSVPGEWLLKSCGFLLECFEKLAKISLSLPGARWVAGQPKIWQILGYYLLLALVLWCLAGKKAQKEKKTVNDKKTRRRKEIVFLLYGLAVWICTSGRGIGSNLEVTMLDVGQGDCFVLRLPGNVTCLIDGGSSDVNAAGKFRLEPFLKARGISSLDYVFVSHGDQDHCNAVEELFSRQRTGIEIRNLVLPCREAWDEKLENLAEEARNAEIKVEEIRSGQSLICREAVLTCLLPDAVTAAEPGNGASMVLKLEYHNFRMLFTGDLERGQEAELIKKLEKTERENKTEKDGADSLPITVLKTAHHGSSGSTGTTLLEKITPAYAWISSGKGNPYGHPHPDTVERLQKAGCQIYNTQTSGAVILWTDGYKIKLTNTSG